MRIELNGNWTFSKAGTNEWKAAVVPSSNFTDLLANGDIPDPFYGTNEADLKWVGESDWIYKRSFDFPYDASSFDAVRLVAKTLDTVCRLTLNGLEIGDAVNFHTEHVFDIKQALKAGANVLEIYFVSPVNFVKEKYRRYGAPVNNNGQNGIVHIRKPQCHFGWDWGPVLPCCGVSGDIYLECADIAKISDVYVKQTHNTNGSVSLDINGEYELLGNFSAEWELTLTAPGGETIRTGGVVDCVENDKIEWRTDIEKPQLWWTRELSGADVQPLYEVTLDLYKKPSGDSEPNDGHAKKALLDTKTVKIGLRTIELDTGVDEYGGNFRFILNGVPIFAKGASVIPPDSFPTRTGKAEIDTLLDAAQFSNMNMLRIWGGGSYGSDYFYDECDRRGLLVWQDFCFACQAYPFFHKLFLDNVRDEVVYNVKRLRNHPSLALWCGNNEIEAMTNLWFFMKDYVVWTKKFFYGTLGKQVREYDAATPYVPGSPMGVDFMRGMGADNVGDTHLWAVWHGLQPPAYYRKRYTRFCSEFGFESLPSVKTLESFAEKKDFAFSSKAFKAHQKCRGGNAKTVYYITQRFRLPEQFEHYAYLSQLNQLECISDATEHWRRNRGRCNGSMYWQFNDCWPTCSWSSMDYFGRYKALQYGARKFFAAKAISVKDTADAFEVWALNDAQSSIDAKIIVKVCDFDGKTLFSDKLAISVPPLSSQRIKTYRLSDFGKFDKKRAYFVADAYESGMRFSRAVKLFEKEKNVEFPKADVKTEVEITSEGTARITLEADKFTRLAALSHTVCDSPFSDNYFDLLPGEKTEITQYAQGLSAQRYSAKLKILSIADVKAEGSRLHDELVRLKVLADPVNFFSKIFTAAVPGDVKCKKQDGRTE